MSRLRGILRYVICLHVVLAVGCVTPDAPGVPGATVIRFPDSVPNLDLLSELRVGAEASAIHLFNVQDLVVDDSGLIYVADRAEESIRVLDRQGAVVRRIGRKGHGPGEFRMPLQISIVKDTLFVQDSGGLLHLFGLGGEYLTSLKVGGALTTAMKIQAAPGRLVIVGMGDSTAGYWRMSMRAMFVRTLDYMTGAVSEPIWSLPLSEMRDIGSGARAPDVGAPYPSVAPTVRGTIYGSAWDEYTIEVRAGDGTLLERASAVVPRVRVSDLDMRLAERRMAALTDAKPQRKRKYRAPLGELVADESGNLLVERADLRQDTMRVWDVVKAGWTVVGRLRTQPSFRLLHFSRCRLYGTAQDEVDVQSIVRLHLEPCPLM